MSRACPKIGHGVHCVTSHFVPRAGRYRVSVTAKEKLRERVERLSEDEAERVLAVVENQKNRGGVGEAIAAGYRRVPQGPEEQAWAESNAREAIREERW